MTIENIGNQKLSIILDPFKKASVTKLYVHAMQSLFSTEWRYSGTVEFTNGNTKGVQEFTGDSFDDVVLKIKAMLDNLE